MIDGTNDSEYSMTHSQSVLCFAKHQFMHSLSYFHLFVFLKNFVFSWKNAKGKSQRNENAILSVSHLSCGPLLSLLPKQLIERFFFYLILPGNSRSKANQDRSSREEPGGKN